MSSVIKSVSVSFEMEKLIKEYGISPSEAMRVGLSVILSDLGEPQFLNKLNIGRKLMAAQQLLQEQAQKIEKLEALNGLVQK